MLPSKDEKEKENRLFISVAPSSSSLSVEGQTSTLSNRPRSLHAGVRTSAIDSTNAAALTEFDASLRDVTMLGTMTAPSHVEVRVVAELSLSVYPLNLYSLCFAEVSSSPLSSLHRSPSRRSLAMAGLG